MTRNARFHHPQKKRSRHRARSGFSLKWVWAIVAVIAAGFYAGERFAEGYGVGPTVSIQQADTLRASFPSCAEGRRLTCIVDGDTFWLAGERIRIADIDAPETNPARCEAEREKGEAATRRLRELLNAGAFSLVAGARDQDQYGRKLRVVMRDGHSIGAVLVAEGLARPWDGARRRWCD